MGRNYNIYENNKYRFIKFSDILKDIRDLFFEEVPPWNRESLQIKTINSFITHCTLMEVLMSYVHLDMSKEINALIISKDTHVDCGGLYNEEEFLTKVLSIIDKSKRSIPILIKNIDCDFDEIDDFLKTGEGKEFILNLELDKEKLRKNIDSFEKFKKFAKIKKLRYILNEIIDKNEFKQLFYS